MECLDTAGLRAGDEVVIEAAGRDRIVAHRAASDLASALGVFDGLYEPGYLDRLRSGRALGGLLRSRYRCRDRGA